MKNKIVFLAAISVITAMLATTAFADKPNSNCANIQSGSITDSVGNTVTLGFDQYGYNYQAHLFVGTYESVDRDLTDGQGGDPYPGDESDPPIATLDDSLIMKWSDPWLANVDCNDDGKLDRGLVDGVVGGTSLGWLTNQAEGDYDSDGDGTQDAHYTYFVKIGWVGAGGSLWGQYEIVQQVLNDPAGGLHGLQNKVVAPGFGLNDHWTTV